MRAAGGCSAAMRNALLAALVGATLLTGGCFVATYTPKPQRLRQPEQRNEPPAYDLWGRSISRAEARELMKSGRGRATLSPANGAVKIDEDLLKLGRQTFYEESFGNEIFLTDVLGMLDGPLKPQGMLKAIKDLDGKGTSNLRVPLSQDAVIGGRRFTKGQLVDTGLDVPRGETAALGLRIELHGPSPKVGITCAACHSTVDTETMKVVHGAPNNDLNSGLLIALSSNSAAFFAHTDVKDFAPLVKDHSRTVVTTKGQRVPLPDPQALEDAVDRVFLKWMPGGFDSMTDLVNNVTQNPDAFTKHAHPYNWSGGFMAGPFNGLSVQTNNVHALNSDAFTEADGSLPRFGVHPEVFYAVLLQNAASTRYRYDPKTEDETPSVFFSRVDPTPYAPGMNEMVALPQYPKASLVEPTGLWNSNPGRPVWQRINATAAWQSTLRPPPPPQRILAQADSQTKQLGRQVFERAGCAECHSGPALTNNRVVPLREVMTQPAGANALESLQNAWAEPLGYAFDEPVPLRKDPKVLRVPTEHLEEEQIRTAYGFGDSPGGYKVKGLVGLWWTAPYLHDGGVAVGQGGEVGVPNTILVSKLLDPYQSLRAVVDRDLRNKVIAANHAYRDLSTVGVEGIGHEFWVDSGAGFSEQEQRALLLYLLTYEPPTDGGGADARSARR